MTFPRMRVWVFGLLVLAWLGFLANLVVRSRGQIIVARPQIETADFVVVASLTDADGRPAARVRIVNVLRAKRKAWKDAAGKDLDVKELAFFSAKQGWNGPGEYVLPLTGRDVDVLPDRIAVLPLTPGYFAGTSEVKITVGKNPDSLAARLSELTGTPLARMRALCDGPDVTLWNVPIRSEDDFKRFSTIVREAGGEALDRFVAEARIYRATPDVIAQVDAVLGLK